MQSCRRRIQRELRASGVTIVSGVNTYVEADVKIGPDTVLQRLRLSGAARASGRIA